MVTDKSKNKTTHWEMDLDNSTAKLFIKGRACAEAHLVEHKARVLSIDYPFNDKFRNRNLNDQIADVERTSSREYFDIMGEAEDRMEIVRAPSFDKHGKKSSEEMEHHRMAFAKIYDKRDYRKRDDREGALFKNQKFEVIRNPITKEQLDAVHAKAIKAYKFEFKKEALKKETIKKKEAMKKHLLEKEKSKETPEREQSGEKKGKPKRRFFGRDDQERGGMGR